MTTATKPREIGPFNLGVNNRRPDTDLVVPKVGAYLRFGVNVDLHASGRMKRRPGFTESLAGADCHSLWATPDESLAYAVDGTTLYELSGPPEAIAKTAVRSGLTPGARLSFTDVNGVTIYTDGTVLRKIIAGADYPLGPPTVGVTPLIAAAGAGALPAGTYQLCFAYLGTDMQQSGSTTPQQIDVAEGQGIAVSGLPAAFPTGVQGVMVYMSSVNGDQLMLAMVLASAQTTLAITTMPQLTGRCQTLLLKPMPAGSIVRANNGRLLVAVGRILQYSDPYALALTQPGRNYIPFTTKITVIESVKTGTYVATEDRTYFFSGDIANAEASEVLPYGAVPGTGGTSPDGLKAWWMSTRGLVQAAGGEIKNVQEQAIAVNKAAAGAAMFRERDGIKQVVTSLFGTEQTGAAAYSYMDAEIIRKGTVL